MTTPQITGSQYATYTGNFLYDQDSQIIQQVNPRAYYDTDPGTYWAIVVIWWLEVTGETDWWHLWAGIKQGLTQSVPVVWEIQQFLNTASDLFSFITPPANPNQKIATEDFKWVIWCLSGYSKAGLAANQLTKLTGSEKNYRLLMEQHMVKCIKKTPVLDAKAA